MTISIRPPEYEDLISADECARRLGLSVFALKRAASRGDIPSIMLRGRRLFLWTDVIKALRTSK